jgi:AcrR family transcriptional regulator
MRARATAAADTRQRILDETTALLKTHFRSDVHLDDVASAAQVSVQTILRLFGSRAALLEGAFKELERHISEQRDRAEPGDIDGAIAGLFDHYEEVGDIVIRNLADEADPEQHFAPQLARHDPSERDMLVDALVCACDVYTWKLLRRDIGRPRDDAARTMAWTVKSLLREV